MNKRVCKVLKNNDWIEIEFKDLKENDIFKLQDYGEVIYQDGTKKDVALCDAYINENGIWSVEV